MTHYRLNTASCDAVLRWTPAGLEDRRPWEGSPHPPNSHHRSPSSQRDPSATVGTLMRRPVRNTLVSWLWKFGRPYRLRRTRDDRPGVSGDSGVSWIRRRLSFWILVPDTRRFRWDDRATRPSSEGRSSTFLPRVEAVDAPVMEAGCPSCGVLSSRVHQRTRQRVRDVRFDGLVRVWWRIRLSSRAR
jgi:zinc-finger of transposase IS204/IS1001/IS1096/IS1165